MITQTKVLKDILRKHKIADNEGMLRVRTKCNHRGEFGSATCHARYLTEDEIKTLKEENQYIKIFNYKADSIRGFSIIEY